MKIQKKKQKIIKFIRARLKEEVYVSPLSINYSNNVNGKIVYNDAYNELYDYDYINSLCYMPDQNSYFSFKLHPGNPILPSCFGYYKYNCIVALDQNNEPFLWLAPLDDFDDDIKEVLSKAVQNINQNN